jgi:fatty-acid desaturase
MSEKGIANNILENVVDFASLIQKLLLIVQTSTCVFNSLQHVSGEQKYNIKQDKNTSNQDPVPLLVQNCLDLLLPCILWEPNELME